MYMIPLQNVLMKFMNDVVLIEIKNAVIDSLVYTLVLHVPFLCLLHLVEFYIKVYEYLLIGKRVTILPCGDLNCLW